MAAFVVRRLLALVPTLLAVSLLVFLILKLTPGDPAFVLAGANATEAQLRNIRAAYHLDDPVVVQYGRYLAQALQGDLGMSLRTHRPVWSELAERLPFSLELAGAAFAVALIVGVLLGIVSAKRQYSLLDNLAMVLALCGISVPIFWLGILLILLLSVQLGWLPTSGAGDWKHLVLPACTLGLSSAAIVARQTRSAMLEVLRQDYVQVARAKGLPEHAVVFRHALRNAAVPTVTILGLQLGNLIGGVVVTETVFAWPGLGRLIVDSITFRDVPMVEGGVLLMAAIFLLTNLVVDLLYGYLNPRIRLA
jgi:ABC-type dipeptide/oligopeptide/nickel transport system permease component